MKRLLLLRYAVAALVLSAHAQAPADQKLAFDVAAVHGNKLGLSHGGDMPSSNVPLGPGDVYTPTGGALTVRNYAFVNIVAFAYKLTGDQIQTLLDKLPTWAREGRYDLNARTDKPAVTKDELRLMVRTLLADRFAFAAHYEPHVTSVFALQLVKPGTTGPRLRPHPADGCSRDFRKDVHEGEPPPSETIEGGYPATCGGLLMMSSSTPHHYVIGARDIPMGIISNAMPSWGDLGRPVVDQTGLTGHYDFALDYIPKQGETPDADPPNFLEAVRKQLGLKLESQKQEVQFLVLDHIAPLTDN